MSWEFDSDAVDCSSVVASGRAVPRLSRWEFYPPLRAVAEFVVAGGLLILSAPIMFFAAALVRITSPGPAIYSQSRVGRGGRVFTIYKIRTMSQDCEKNSGPCWATKRDPRITRVGRFLRATHIDELPQLVNVLKGDMGLIGPRPERPEFVPKLEYAIPRYRERLSVRPGVTGFAQVQLPADSDLESVRRKLTYDLYYIDAMSPWLDLCILLCTTLKMAGIPFSVLRRLFAMPSEAEVADYCRIDSKHLVPQPA